MPSTPTSQPSTMPSSQPSMQPSQLDETSNAAAIAEAQESFTNAIQSGSKSMLEALLKSNDIEAMNFNNFTYNALANAVFLADIEAVRLVLKKTNANPNQQSNQGMTYLHLAAIYGNLQMAEVLCLEFDLDVLLLNAAGKNAWQLAREAGHSEVAKFLLNHSNGKVSKSAEVFIFI